MIKRMMPGPAFWVIGASTVLLYITTIAPAVTIPVMGGAHGAFTMWLSVRVINRRERWAKWMLVAAIGLPVLYVLSFCILVWIGPNSWMSDGVRRFLGWLFLPLIKKVMEPPSR
jgi:apolipoprotein N-acyltransferase